MTEEDKALMRQCILLDDDEEVRRKAAEFNVLNALTEITLNWTKSSSTMLWARPEESPFRMPTLLAFMFWAKENDGGLALFATPITIFSNDQTGAKWWIRTMNEFGFHEKYGAGDYSVPPIKFN